MTHVSRLSVTLAHAVALAAAGATWAQVPGQTSAGNPTVATQRVGTDLQDQSATRLRLDLGVPISVDQNVQGDHEVLYAQLATRY